MLAKIAKNFKIIFWDLDFINNIANSKLKGMLSLFAFISFVYILQFVPSNNNRSLSVATDMMIGFVILILAIPLIYNYKHLSLRYVFSYLLSLVVSFVRMFIYALPLGIIIFTLKFIGVIILGYEMDSLRWVSNLFYIGFILPLISFMYYQIKYFSKD